MAGKKNRRMFSREQRRQARAEALARAETITQEDLDRSTIASALGSMPAGVEPIAEVWLSYRDEDDPTDFERELIDALARQFERMTGEGVSVDAAEIAIEEGEAEFRDAYGVAMDERYVEPSLVERAGTTDAGYEERILDAEMAAGESDEEE